MTRLSHSFSVEHAELYGVECAILITHFQFWIEQNQTLGRNFHDDRTWMYQTQNDIVAIYPYWNRDKVQALLQKLVEHEVIIKGNYNKSSFDKTTWYAFKNEKMFTKERNRTIGSAKPPNPECGTTPTIPDTNPDAKQITTTAASPPAAASFEKTKQQPKQSTQQPIDPKPNIYPCLEKVNIPKHDKIQITNNYPISTVIPALEWSLDPNNPPKICLAAQIKFACKHGLSLEQQKKKTPYEILCESFKHGENYRDAICDLNPEGVAFTRGMKHEQMKIDKFFSWKKFNKMCESFGIKFNSIFLEA